MAYHHDSRSGSLAYSPKKRAKSLTPRIKTYRKEEADETKPAAFAGYKAGMTHLLTTDTKKYSTTRGKQVSLAATIVECPPLKVVAARLYKNNGPKIEAYTEAWAPELPKNITRKIKKLKKQPTPEEDVKKIDAYAKNASEIRLLVCTQPDQIGLKKTPEVFEIPVQGKNVEEKLAYAKKALGKELSAKDVLKEGDHVDIISVTKGKGTQGPVKRWGVHIQGRKAHGHRRHIGSGGPWKPSKTLWRIPKSGRMGVSRRTELNKQILKLGENPEEINPQGGIRHYGEIKTNYVLIKGSVPGPKKRLIALRPAIRGKDLPTPQIEYVSKESQQG